MTHEAGVHPPLWDVMMLKLPLPWSMIGYQSPAPPSNSQDASLHGFPTLVLLPTLQQLCVCSLRCWRNYSSCAQQNKEKKKQHIILCNPWNGILEMFTVSVVPLVEVCPNRFARWIHIPTRGLNSSLLSVVTQERWEKIISLLHHSVNRIWALSLKV